MAGLLTSFLVGSGLFAKTAVPAVKGVNSFVKKHLPALHRAGSDAAKRVGKPLAESIERPIRREQLKADFNDAAGRRVQRIGAAQRAAVAKADERLKKRLEKRGFGSGRRDPAVDASRRGARSAARPADASSLTRVASADGGALPAHREKGPAMDMPKPSLSPKFQAATTSNGPLKPDLGVKHQAAAASHDAPRPSLSPKFQAATTSSGPSKPDLGVKHQAATKSNDAPRMKPPQNAPRRADLAPPTIAVLAPSGPGGASRPSLTRPHEVPSHTPRKAAQPPKMDPKELKAGVHGAPVPESSQLRTHFNPKARSR